MSSDNCQQSGCDGKVYKSGYCVEHFVQYGQAAEPSTPTSPAAATSPQGSTSSSGGSAKFSKFGGGGQKCTICDKTSYPAETIQFDMKPYHKECFRCLQCKKELDAPNASQFDAKIYCKMCFQRNGFNRKQAEVKWEQKETKPSAAPSKFGGGGHPCTTCGKTVYAGETVQFEGRIFHPKCLICHDCGKDCHVNEAAQFENNIYCKRCWEKGRYNKKQLLTTEKANTGDKPKSAVSSRFANLGGGGNKCYTCQQTVYPAETVQYEQRPYHAKCFKCCHCNREILQVAQAEHKGDKVYCSKCFNELGLWQATLNEKA